MDYMLAHWRGRLSINKSFWLNGMLVSFVFMIVKTILILCLNGKSFSALVEASQTGQFNDSIALPLYFSLPLSLLGYAYLVWWGVGTWRACNNPENNPKGMTRPLLIKAYLVLVILSVFSPLASLISHAKLE